MAKLGTTNLRFPEETYRELRCRAARDGTSTASIVRQAVERYRGRSGSMCPEPAPAGAIIGSVGGSAGDESVNHDHYLYGWAKEEGREAAGRHGRVARPVSEGRPASRKRRGVGTKK